MMDAQPVQRARDLLENEHGRVPAQSLPCQNARR
jgi:hypothetical protein